MRALLKEAAGPGLTLAEVAEPEPGPKEVLVRVIKAAVCGTDLHIYHWDEWARSVVEPPLVLGHEFVGEVVALGPGRDAAPGGRPRLRRRAHHLRPVPQLPRGKAAPVPPHQGVWASTATARSPSWW